MSHREFLWKLEEIVRKIDERKDAAIAEIGRTK